MKQHMLKERVELLSIGETLGFPRLAVGRTTNGTKLAIRAGQAQWERFCAHAHSTRIPAALRIGRILRDNGITPYNPRSSVTFPKGLGEAVIDSVAFGDVVVELEHVGADLLEEITPPVVPPPPTARHLRAAARQQRYRDRQRERSKV